MNSLLYAFFWVFINLDMVCFLSLLIGCLFFFFSQKRKLCGTFFIPATFMLLIINISPLGPWMIMTFENQFQQPQELPQNVDGIIFLGGSFSIIETKERNEPVANLVGTRLYHFMSLGRRLPQTKLIATGNTIESEWTAKILHQEGFSPERILIENESRCTEDHPRLLKDHINITHTYLLVTSAFNMPRAVGLFKGAGFTNIIPYPVDFHTPGHMSANFWISTVLQRLTPIAFKQSCIEWAGLVTYYIKGLSKTLLPSGKAA